MSSFSLIRPKLAEKKGINLAWDFLWRYFSPVPLKTVKDRAEARKHKNVSLSWLS